MGASVYLYNRYDELVRKGLSNEQGRFAFDALAPDLYSIRVILASFVPAERHNISVLPNSENRLDINLTSVLSSIGMTTTPVSPGTLMTDDWKWVLRTSQATRPVLRFLPEIASRGTSSSHSVFTGFSNTTGVVKLSAGDGESFARGTQQDLGTAFAIATSLASSARVQLSGNVGYAGSSALPGAGIRTSYSRSTGDGSNPEIALTMRQVYLTPRGAAAAPGSDSAPVLRTISMALLDRMDISDNLHFDYGFDSESISYFDRINYVSPFVRATFDAGAQGRVRVAFTSGGSPTELLARDDQKSGELEQDLTALAAMPTLSVSDSHLTVERTQNLEIGYERVAGGRTYSLGAYDESVSNAAFMLSGPADFISAADLLPDLGSRSSIFNIGSFHRIGYNAGVKQTLGDHAEVSVMAGRAGVLTAPGAEGSYMDSQTLAGRYRPGAARLGDHSSRGHGAARGHPHRRQLRLDRLPRADAGAFVRDANWQSGYRRECAYQPTAADDSHALAHGGDGRSAQPAGARVSAFGRSGRTQRPHEFAAPGAGRIEFHLLGIAGTHRTT